jgi:tetratricopeptide (TPR) repeat protein
VPEEAGRRRLEAALCVALGNVAIVSAGHGSGEAGRAYERAAELCRGLGEDELLATALWGLWNHRTFTGDLAGALPLAEEVVGLARQRGAAPDQLSRSLCVLGISHYLLGRLDLAKPLFEEAASGPGSYDPGAGPVSGGSFAQGFLARMLAGLGELDRAAALAADAVERARRAGHLPSLLNVHTVCSVAAWLLRDPPSLRGWALELAGLAEPGGFPIYAVRARMALGLVALEEGRTAEGLGLVAEGMAAQRALGTTAFFPHYEASLSDAHLLAGDAPAALAQIEEAVSVAARVGDAWFAAELHRRLARVLLRLPSRDTVRAEGEFRRAIEIARAQSALLFELRAAADLARLLRDQGRVAEARDLLAPVYAAFTEGFAFPDLVEARALLADLGAAPMDDAGRIRGEAPPSAGPEVRAEAPGPSPAAP